MYRIGGAIVSVNESGRALLSDTMDTFTGQSGSPLFYSYEGKTYTAGLIAGNDETDTITRASLFTKDMYSDFMATLGSTERAIDPSLLPENLIFGSSTNDQFRGTHRKEKIVADAGDDIIYASFGADNVIGGAGRDTVEYDLEAEPI
jgi:Ca2+-binding RTX toxin-like protein